MFRLPALMRSASHLEIETYAMPSPNSSDAARPWVLIAENRPGHSPPQILHWPTERARRWTCEFLNSAPGIDTILAVIAIGSAVRPNVMSADLDLIVISAGVKPIHISHPMEIDLRVYSAATVDDQLASGHDLLGWRAIKFGKPLFQRDHFLGQDDCRMEGPASPSFRRACERKSIART